MTIDIEIITPVDEIERMALQAIRDELNKRLPKVAELVATDFSRIKPIFVNSNEYQALIDGPLDAHFGIPKNTALDRLDVIVDTLIKSVVVEAKRVSVRSKRLTGGLTVKAFQADFQDLLGLPEGQVITAKNELLPWLEWLLIRGDEIIVQEYRIDFGSHPQSRSGKAIMISDEASVWRVPPGVSGTIRNNWITRTVEKSFQFIDRFLSNSIQKNIDKVF